MSFWGELKRRNVFKVGAAYVIVAWLIVQVANTFFPILHLPEWIVTLVAFLLILGLPVALILAWAYEMTPEGVKLTKKVPLADSITQVTGRKLNYILTGLIIVLVGYIVFLKFYPGIPTAQTDKPSTVAEQIPPAVDVKEAPKTIAVLPFENLSSDPEQEYFVDGLSEEILNSLTKIPDLYVTSRTSSFYFKNTEATIQKIADVLNVSYILEGSVRKAENALRITAQLIRVADDRHLWSETYDRELKDIFAIQEDIATIVAGKLKVTLGIGESFKQLGGTNNLEAYEQYLVALGLSKEGNYASKMNALEKINAVLKLDSEFALAWAAKASLHFAISQDTPEKQAATERSSGIQAALKAVELEPNLSDGYSSLGLLKLSGGDFFEAEKAFSKALKLANDRLSGFVHYDGILDIAAGYFKKASEFLEELRRNDPLNQAARAQYLLNLTLLGDPERAEEEYDLGIRSFDGDWYLGDCFISDTRLGSGKVLSRNDIVGSSPVYDLAREYIAKPEKGAEELRRLCANDSDLGSGNFFEAAMISAYFGDSEFSMDAVKKGFEMEGSGIFFVWVPVMHDVRQTPRFKKFIREIGLVDFWNEYGWPDICHPTDNGDFVCD